MGAVSRFRVVSPRILNEILKLFLSDLIPGAQRT